MRVLHVHSGNMYGGVESLLATIAGERAGPSRATSHDFAICFDGRVRRELVAAGSTVHDIGAVRWSRPHWLVRGRLRLRRVLRSNRPDVVVTHSAWAQSLFASVVRAEGIALAAWLHDVPDGRHWLQRLAARHPPDLVIANSAYTARLAPLLYAGRDVAVVYPPVALHGVGDRNVAHDVRRELGAAATAKVVVQVSRFDPGKGLHILIEALGYLPARLEWECWIVGGAQRPQDLRYQAALVEQARRSGVGSRVKFLGLRHDVSRLLAGADVFCQPNVAPETFGIVLVEALDAGVPVVTSAIGGALEIVTPDCGRLTPPGDAPAAAEAIASLLEDGAAREGARIAGPAQARALSSPSRQICRVEELLGGLVH